MANTEIKKQYIRKVKRGMRVRRRLHGTASKPRLSVVKSNNHIQVQLIDDDRGVTLGGSATFAKEFKNTEFSRKNKKSARKLGEVIAGIALKQNIKEVVFDRGPFKYHGILAELGDAARSAGLCF